MNELVELFRQGGARASVSAIGGMGGIGKSALAIHVAHRVVDHYPDGQVVVDMRGAKEDPLTPAQAMGKVVTAFTPTVQLPEEEDAAAPLYRGALAGKRALILLDDAANDAQVRPLLVDPPTALLVTSRRTITLTGGRRVDLDEMTEPEADDFLHQIVGQNRATEAELDEIAGLCRRLPLALRVAGTFLDKYGDWSAADYAKALAEEGVRLKVGDDRKLNVEAVLGLSAARLAADDRPLAEQWQMLSVFPAAFARPAAAAVWDTEEHAAHEGLSALAERNLLQHDPESDRYRLHDLMREVARDALRYGGGETDPAADEGRLALAAARHAEHYRTVLGTADALYLKGEEGVLAGLALFDMEWTNIEAGHAWAAAHTKDDDAAARVCNAYPDDGAYVLNLRQHPRERISWLEAAVGAARRLEDRGLEGTALGNLGLAHADLGETRRAIELYEQRLEIAREIGDRQGEGNALGNLGNAHANFGETRRAIEFHEQHLEIAREIDDRRGEGAALGNLGNAYADLGETRRAIELHEQRLEIASEIGDRRGEGAALGNLGNAYADLGETRRAIEYYEQHLEIAREIGDRRGEGNSLYNLGDELAKAGERGQAITRLQEALDILKEIESPHVERARAALAQLESDD